MAKCDHRGYSKINIVKGSVYYCSIFPKKNFCGVYQSGVVCRTGEIAKFLGFYDSDGKGIRDIARFVDRTLRNEQKANSFLFLLEL